MDPAKHILVSGLTVVFLLAFSTGSAFAMDVGETVDLLVPDISYFPDEPQIRQFTCRAVTEHAYFLVQDTTFFDLPNPDDEFQIIWDSLVTQTEVDSIAAQFEGAGVNVFGTTTSLFGPVPQTVNDDDRLWIVLADVPDYHPIPNSGIIRLGNWVCTWPQDFDGDSNTGNNHNAFYVNLGAYKNMPGTAWEEVRGSIHTWSVPTGLGQFLRIANNPVEEKWVVRGLGLVAQFSCYGLTSTLNGNLGIEGFLDAFAMGGGIELTSWCSGQTSKDFGANQGGEFLWFKYLEQRVGSSVLSEIVQSSGAGMLSIASAIDPAIPDSISVETSVYPLYEDWLITNIVAHVSGSFAGGIYRYDFLDGTGLIFTMIDDPASFLGEFDTYPIPTWIAPHTYGISAQTFAAQYANFEGDYAAGGNTTVYFDGMYNQNNGSGANINGRWIVHRIVFADDSTLQSVDSLEFDDLFNGTFELDGDRTCLVLTNNNPGGTAMIRYTLSQDTASKSLFLSAHQNQMNQHFLQVYTSLFRDDTQIPCGYDWVGPKLEISSLTPDGSPDSTAILEMDPLTGSLWTGRAYSWSAGNFRLVCSGYDSLGLNYSDSLQFAVGYGGAEKLVLDIQTAELEIAGGILSSQTQASLIEANALSISAGSDVPLNSTGAILTGIIEGPVAVYPGVGVLSFPAGSCEGAIFRFDGEQWQELDSYFLEGRMYASVIHEGIHVLGLSPGLFSPGVLSVPVLQGSFPNPFLSQVSFRFSLPEVSAVTLSVYDITGRLLKIVVDYELPGGLHTVSWNGRDNSGSSVPSGVYFARLETSGYSETLKLVRVGAGGGI
ncbi:MAG: T9SS type A sorting domain-containing protein [Candidatus Sabulitectum sp.]|nr:T9SS type A sorting domain-containing protein [Candidatus Sabulitectum sp.]